MIFSLTLESMETISLVLLVCLSSEPGRSALCQNGWIVYKDTGIKLLDVWLPYPPERDLMMSDHYSSQFGPQELQDSETMVS